jgi:preprotein translocase subunit SecG
MPVIQMWFNGPDDFFGRGVTVQFKDYINIAQILVAIVLTVVILLQAKGSGVGTALGGGTSGSFRTRRGVEKTLFQLTIVLAALFLAVSAWGVRASVR